VQPALCENDARRDTPFINGNSTDALSACAGISPLLLAPSAANAIPATDRQSMFTTAVTTNRIERAATSLVQAGHRITRYGLVVVLAWIGFGKYVKMDAKVLIEHSPLMSWIFDFFSATTVARGLGTMEIIAALLIALRPLWPRVSVAGSALAVILFLGTLSFLFTSPGVVVAHVAGVPVLSAQPGQFLLKDLVLIGVAVWTLGDSLRAILAHDNALPGR
jgi:uncharacterized membrane protein YkgB